MHIQIDCIINLIKERPMFQCELHDI